MLWVDWFILIIAVVIIIFSAIMQSNDDAVDAFRGSSSDLFKDKKVQGSELFLNRTMAILFGLFVLFILISNLVYPDRLFNFFIYR